MVWGKKNSTYVSKSGSQRWLILLAAIMAVVIIGGCGAKPVDANPEITVTPSPTPTATPAVETPVPEPVYPFTFPLTGMGSDEEAAVKARPIMVMVENQAQSRPQTGLTEADLVYEILAEGEITRFVAIYQSKSPENIGPVRSIRPYFIEIGDALDALIVHAGYSPDAIKMINQRKLPHFDEIYGDGAYYWRDKIRKAPHNLYTSIELIRKGAEKKKFSPEWNGKGLSFAAKDTVIAGQAADKVRINYIHGYHVDYEFDQESGQYNRFMEDEAHKDKETGEQLTATNILVLKTSHKVLDSAGRRAVNVFGPGVGYFVQNGKMQEITWQMTDGLIRAYANNVEVSLIPGQTWIHIIPESSEATFAAAN